MTMHNSVLQHELSKLPDDTLVFIESRGETHRIAGITVQRVRIYDDGTHRSADDDELGLPTQTATKDLLDNLTNLNRRSKGF